MKTYAILGGGGSFGTHCALHLLAIPGAKQVVGIGRNPLRDPAFTLGVERQPDYEYRAFHIYHEQDLLLDYLDELQPDVIINFAAQGEGAVSWSNSWRFFETNCVALAKLVEALSKRQWWCSDRASRFIQIGTSELYGSVDVPASEDAPIVPSSPYAASKAAFDMHLISLFRATGFPMNIIRPSNAYGPGQLLHRVIPRALLCALTREKLPLHGGGRAKKSYLHARDLAYAIQLVADSAPFGEVYNVGPDAPVSILEVVETCANETSVPLNELIEIVGERQGQDAQYWLDSSKIKRLGWEQKIPFTVGVADTANWVRSNFDVLRKTPTTYTLRA